MKHPPRLQWLLPMLSTTVLYAVAYLACWLSLGAQIRWERVPYDYGMNLLIAYLLYAVSRRVWPFLLIQCLLFAVFYLGSALKIALFGRPLLPEDIYSMTAFVKILGPAGWVLVGLPLGMLVVLFVYNLDVRSRLGRLGALLLVALPLGATARDSTVMGTLDGFFGNTPWDQRQNFVWRGGAVHFMQELLRASAMRTPTPQAEEVEAAVQRRLAVPAALEAPRAHGNARRNLHVVLEESFWDPTPLTAAGFSESPLDPRFTALWREAGYSRALSPAFGGQTANAEFEVLCGFPVDDTVVRFESGLENVSPCLPRLLREAGFRTVASHPNAPDFWNRESAYAKLGFETFWSKRDFDLADRNGDPLSDRSLHVQVDRKLRESADARPVFDYIVTFDGHWPYTLGPERPARVHSVSQVAEVRDYANTLYYKSREMVDAIERWRREDPDALIVIFGDHLPLLGWNPGGFVESGLLAASDEAYTPEMYLASAATPLLVIDGRRGVVPLGDVPLYRLGGLLLQWAGVEPVGLFRLLPPPATHRAHRPLAGVVMSLGDTGAISLCRSGDTSAGCAPVLQWMADVRLLGRDVFSGDQHALQGIGSRDRLDPVGALLAEH